MWNSFEWSSITQASGKTQRPLLRQALREVRSKKINEDDEISNVLYEYFSNTLVSLQTFFNDAPSSTTDFKKRQGFGDLISGIKKDLTSFIN